jgi:RNA polymerase sigma-70 factor (ECF subfamily)
MSVGAVDRRSDEELLGATRGEPAAFGELYRRHERQMLGFFLYATRSAELASDLTAETFAAALESVERFDHSQGEATAWLFGIARHVLSRSLERGRVEDRARRRLCLPVLVVDDQAIERVEALASLNGRATSLLAELPTGVREAVQGRVLDEREYTELAATLRCSPSVVRKRVSRGLARLRKRMEEKA